ncbi:MAG TPA: hypothetical protein VGU71_00820 [Candidatus Dormibacteraeota bacterium]|nr:hypothetical protein [Candidatus Dormibacteraeota bacterium]
MSTLLKRDHELPPSPVANSVPASPPATQDVAVVQLMALTEGTKPLDKMAVWLVHVPPPSAVVKMVADVMELAPTAKHELGLGQVMPFKSLVVPEVLLDQLAPPSTVSRTSPPVPTAMHSIVVGQLTPLTCPTPVSVLFDQVVPPLLVADSVLSLVLPT